MRVALLSGGTGGARLATGLAAVRPDWQEYRAPMVSEGRVLLHITVDPSGPTRQG